MMIKSKIAREVIRNVQITKRALIQKEIAGKEFVQWPIVKGCGAR